MDVLQAGRGALRSAAGCTLLIAVLTGCGHPADGTRASASPSATAGVPGRATVRGPGVGMDITSAVAHLDASGNGSLTMSVRSEEPVPDHLDFVATPDSGRGQLVGAAHGTGGTLQSAGILIPAGGTVLFGPAGPRVDLTRVRGVTARHTLPVSLEFGVAGLVRLDAVVRGD